MIDPTNVKVIGRDVPYPPLWQDWTGESASRPLESAPVPEKSAKGHRAHALDRAAAEAELAYEHLRESVEWSKATDPEAARYERLLRLVGEHADMVARRRDV